MIVPGSFVPAEDQGYIFVNVQLPDGAAYYLCGPLPFMQGIRSALIDRGVPARDIQYEVFGPDLWQADLGPEQAPGRQSAHAGV